MVIFNSYVKLPEGNGIYYMIFFLCVPENGVFSMLCLQNRRDFRMINHGFFGDIPFSDKPIK
jgi:hypothetical protein